MNQTLTLSTLTDGQRNFTFSYFAPESSDNPFLLEHGLLAMSRSCVEDSACSAGVYNQLTHRICKEIVDICGRSCIRAALLASDKDADAFLRTCDIEAVCFPQCKVEGKKRKQLVVPVQLAPLFFVRMRKRLLCAHNEQQFRSVIEATQKLVVHEPRAKAVLDLIQCSSWMWGRLAPTQIAPLSPQADDDDVHEDADIVHAQFADLRTRSVKRLWADMTLQKQRTAVIDCDKVASSARTLISAWNEQNGWSITLNCKRKVPTEDVSPKRQKTINNDTD